MRRVPAPIQNMSWCVFVRTECSLRPHIARYHMAHTVAALAAVGMTHSPSRAAMASSAFFLAGNALFSGSLYALVLTEDGKFARVAPYGGGCLMLGWLGIAAAGAML